MLYSNIILSASKKQSPSIEIDNNIIHLEYSEFASYEEWYQRKDKIWLKLDTNQIDFKENQQKMYFEFFK